MNPLLDLDALMEPEDDDITTKKNRDLPNEIWKSPPDYLNIGNYTVSNMGRVKQKRFGIRNGSIDKYGYISDCLTTNDKKDKRLQRHRLVALTFLEKPGGKPQVDHINRNKLDNTLVNLRWVTSSENALNRDSYEASGRPVVQLDIEFDIEITKFDSVKEATKAMKGRSVSHISHAASGRKADAYGWRWKYLDVDDLPGEEWRTVSVKGKDIPVSNMGRIRYKTGRTTTGSEIGDYLKVEIGKKAAMVHILVCRAFHGPKPDDQRTVNHKDHNTHNNKASNLEWASQFEQVFHARPPGEGKKKHSSGKIVLQKDLETGEVIREYPSVRNAVKETGFTHDSIYKVCAYGRETTNGFDWCYK